MRSLMKALLRLWAQLWALFLRGPELFRHDSPQTPPLTREQWEPSGKGGFSQECRF